LEYWPESFTFRYVRDLWGLAKGSGKTPIAACIGALKLMARATGFGREGLRHNGRIVVPPDAIEHFFPPGPGVLVGAASLNQADRVFGDMGIAISESPTLRDLAACFDLEIQLLYEPGTAERVAAVAGSNDGARTICLISDELHEWIGRLARVHMILEGALKRRNAQSLAISTAGYDKKTILGRQYDRGVKIAQGKIRDDGTLFEWYEAPPDIEFERLNLEKPDHYATWLRGVRAANPGVGDFAPLRFVRDRYDGALLIPLHEWERYHGNRWTHSSEKWLPPGRWDACARPVAQREVAPQTSVVLAFCGTYDGESAGLVGCTHDGRLFVVGNWEAPDEQTPYLVRHNEVDAEIDRAFRTWRVTFLACNPPGWDADIERWTSLYGDEVVGLYELRKLQRFVDACGKFYAAVTNRELSHDGSEELAEHLDSAEPRRIREGTYIDPPKGGAPINLARAAVMAFDQRARAVVRRHRSGGALGR
jgi:hypothetical protein